MRRLAIVCGVLLAGCGEGGKSTVEVEQVSADEPAAALPPAPPIEVTPARSAEETASAVKQTHAVMSALMAETSLDSSGLRVATDEPRKQVVLAGRVPSQRQRELAERLARERAPGYEIRNGLEVAAD